METSLFVEINTCTGRTQLISFRWIDIPASLLQWCILTKLLPAKNTKSKMNIYDYKLSKFYFKISNLLRGVNKTNRNKHVNASSVSILKSAVGLQLVLRTTDKICIAHHLMSAITISTYPPPLLRSRLADCFTRSMKQDQSQSLENNSASTRRSR